MEKHVTATVYLVTKIDGEARVLLHHHTKHNIWVGVGGHAEKDENPEEAAVREVKEETGLDVMLFSDKKDFIQTQYVTELVHPFIILEEKISAGPNQPAHYHIDCIYFAVVHNPQDVRMQEEFQWVSLSELDSMELEKEVRYNAKSAIKICKK